MPEAMLGDWSIARQDGVLERAKEGHFSIDKHMYAVVDEECEVIKVEKQSETLYTVEASCKDAGSDLKPEIMTNNFELIGKDQLLITPFGS